MEKNTKEKPKKKREKLKVGKEKIIKIMSKMEKIKSRVWTFSGRKTAVCEHRDMGRDQMVRSLMIYMQPCRYLFLCST